MLMPRGVNHRNNMKIYSFLSYVGPEWARPEAPVQSLTSLCSYPSVSMALHPLTRQSIMFPGADEGSEMAACMTL